MFAWGFKVKLQGLGFIIKGLWFRVKGKELAVEGLGFSPREQSVPWHNEENPFPALQERRLNEK